MSTMEEFVRGVTEWALPVLPLALAGGGPLGAGGCGVLPPPPPPPPPFADRRLPPLLSPRCSLSCPSSAAGGDLGDIKGTTLACPLLQLPSGPPALPAPFVAVACPARVPVPLFPRASRGVILNI